jgi:AcrR family transcriptional regulator
MENREKLRSRQMLAIQHIIASSTIEDACRKAKISKGTFYAWLKDEAFKEELKRQRDGVIKEGLDRLKMAMTKAIDGLIDLMVSPRADLRRWVYKDIIDYAFKSIEIENIEERINRIEQSLGEKNGYKKKIKSG